MVFHTSTREVRVAGTRIPEGAVVAPRLERKEPTRALLDSFLVRGPSRLELRPAA